MQLKKVLTDLICALIVLLTALAFRYDVGNLGYISLVDAAIMIVIQYITPSYAILTVSVPCALADMITGHGYYALYTFIIRVLQGYLLANRSAQGKKYLPFAALISVMVIVLYGAADLMMYGSKVLPYSLLYNLVQMALSFGVLCIYNLIIRKLRK